MIASLVNNKEKIGALVAVGALLAACSLAVDTTATQCESDADCAGFPGTTCIAGGCVNDDSPQPTDAGPDKEAGPDKVETSCSSNQDCIAGFGDDYLCINSECQSVRSQDCGEAIGDFKKDDAWLVGAILPTFGAHERSGKAMRNALSLAVGDFSGDLPPLPGEVFRRPLGVIVCNETDNVTRAADFLVDTIGVKAILGPALGGPALTLAAHLHGKGGPFMVSPAATVDLSSLPSEAAVRRSCADEAQEARAIRSLIEDVIEPALLNPPELENIRLAVLYRNDEHGKGLRNEVLDNLMLNGQPARGGANSGYLIEADYGNPDAVPPVDNFASAVAASTGSGNLPHVILVIGQTEAAQGVIASVEANWPGGADRPEWVVSHGLKVPELLDVIAARGALSGRLRGAAPGRNESASEVTPFLIRYKNRFDDGTDPSVYGTTHTFDAFYQLAYGMAAMGKTDFSAGELASLFDTTIQEGAQKVEPGPNGIDAALETLDPADGPGPIDLDGRSGDLNPDGKGVKSQIQIWCTTGSEGNFKFMDSGAFLEAEGTSLKGTTGASCMP